MRNPIQLINLNPTLIPFTRRSLLWRSFCVIVLAFTVSSVAFSPAAQAITPYGGVHQAVQAQWSAAVGAQTNDKGIQALAFLPNEIWIHAGDRITWTFEVDEIHTLTFLTAGQPRPFFADGCPGFSEDPATFDGSTCVTTPPMIRG